MTFTPVVPPITPVTVTGIPSIFRAAPDIQPFTYTDGMTYTRILENIRSWLYNTLVPSLNANFGDIRDNWDTNVQAIDDAVNVALANQANEVDEQLTTTLQEIVAGANAALNDATILSALESAGSTALAYLDGRYQKSTTALTNIVSQVLAGTGIDPTGATDSSAAVQTFLNNIPAGSTVTVPGGATIKLVTGITISKRLRLTGTGELRYSGTGSTAVINATADEVDFEGLYITNPATAPLVAGIVVTANKASVRNCRVTNMNDGIQVAATGEFHDIIITGNLVEDVTGSGKGSGDNTYQGESNGDGIVCWGASATISNNRVTCKTGSDARIGIHMEALSDQEVTPYTHKDSVGSIAGNIITGQFRRGIVAEGVAHVAITGNSIADATMWGIALIGLAHHNIVSGNTIKWTRTASDNQYSFGSPSRCGIMLFCIQEELHDVQIVNNIIRSVPGANLPFGIVLQADSSVAAEAAKFCRIAGNIVNDESITMGIGIYIAANVRAIHIDDNIIPIFQGSGINVAAPTECRARGNQVNGPGNANSAIGIKFQGGGENSIDGNRISNTVTAIQAYFGTTSYTVNENKVRNATTGIDFYQTGGIVVSNANMFSGVTTPRTNIPGVTFTSVGNSA